MRNIRAVAFDLFNTLITVDMPSRYASIDRLLDNLKAQDIAVHADDFMPVYRDVVQEFVSEAERLGKETHNGVWISTTLQQLGIDIQPQDPRVAEAVEAYFSAFVDNARPLPGTADMLAALKPRYRLGLLSNLTHGPAARQILDHLNLTSYFDVLLVSGDLGYRKPHPLVFQSLIAALGVPPPSIAFVGDDPRTDVQGSRLAGLQPVQTVYARRRQDAAALMTPPAEPPVPTIASWQDLLTLLDVS
jgi:putative hydrolase of the HAD superfamily